MKYLDDFFKEIAQDSELKGNIEDYLILQKFMI